MINYLKQYADKTYEELINSLSWFDIPFKLKAIFAKIPSGDSRPYKVYTALVSQSETNDPIATVLENTLGGTVVWTRQDIGYYRANLTGAFVDSQKVGISGVLDSTSSRISAYVNDENSVEFYSSTYANVASDLGFYGQMVEIRVYN